MRKLTIIIAALLLAAALAGCIGGQNEPAGENAPDINPKAEAAGKDTSDVTLYYSYNGEFMLAGETRSIDVPVSETLEAATVRALISGPSPDRDELSPLFWQGVELVNVSAKGGYIFVTLSESFISTDPPQPGAVGGMTPEEQKQLAIYSIVNTLTEMGKYARVQIEVNRAGGVGSRITLSEAGFGDDDRAYLEPLGRESDMILTPENTLAEALRSFMKKDWIRLYTFTAHVDNAGTTRPDIDDFSKELAAIGNVLESYTMTDSIVSYDGQTAVVMLSYTIKRRGGDTVHEENIPVVLVRKGDIWKLTYSSLVSVLINI